MSRFEYKVVPAPAKGLKGKGVKGAEARFSHGLEDLINGLAGDGWEYQRAEILPSVERAGLTGTTTEWRNVLIFRRQRESDTETFKPELLPAPAALAPGTDDAAEPDAAQQKPDRQAAAPWDNGVEDTDNADNVGASLTRLAASRNPEKSKG
jgi:hypothetical protein